MHVLKAMILVVLIVIPLGTTTVLVLTVRALRRANRVVEGRRSVAPLGWLWSWHRAPRLHRRLRRAVHTAQAAVAPLGSTVATRKSHATTTPLHEVAGELVERAVLVDDWLVAASRLDPFWRRSRLVELAAEVRELERSAYRLQDVCAHWRLSLDRAVQATVVGPPDFGERLDAVQAALLELPTGV